MWSVPTKPVRQASAVCLKQPSPFLSGRLARCFRGGNSHLIPTADTFHSDIYFAQIIINVENGF